MYRFRQFALCLSAALFMLAMLVPFGITSVQSRTPPPPIISPRIIGGEPAAPGNWPWLVGLLIAEVQDTPTALFCGGALIDDDVAPVTTTRWVLTAAHCLPDRMPEDIQVLVGQQDLAAATPQQRIDVVQIIVHPLYQIGSHENNDIALLELASPVTGITPIRIARPADAARFAPGNAGLGCRMG